MKKISSLIMILLLLCNSIITVFPTKTSAETLDNVIKNIYVTKENGTKPIDNGYSMSQTVRVNVDWEIENGSAKSGDTFSFNLPKILIINKQLDFDIKDPNGDVIAKGHADRWGHKVTVTFTDYVEKHSNIKGTMFILSKFDRDIITDGGDYTLVFTDDNTVSFEEDIHVNPSGFNNPDEKLSKYGYVDPNDDTLINWIVRVNVAGIDMMNAVATDELSPGHTLIKDSIKIYKVKWEIENGKLIQNEKTDVTDTTEIMFSLPNKFTINFGNITDGYGYYISYHSKIDGNDYNDFSNHFILNANDTDHSSIGNAHRETSGGGDGDGENSSVEIMKVDSNDGHALVGAEFDVIRTLDNKLVGHLMTDSDGKGSLSKLPFGNYELVETKAPDGYKLDQTPVKFTTDKTHKVIQLKIDNRLLNGSVILTKIDKESKETLAGAEFKLVTEQGKEIKENVVTDKKGKLVVEKLVPGNYQFIETKAPKGYALDKTPVAFEIKAGETSKAGTVTKENKLETGTFEL
ncbi:hypothetical protein CN984_30485, partial [Bacillus cereus]